MPGLDLPPEVLEEIRQTEPVSCPLCAYESGETNDDLTIVDRSAGADRIGAVFRCSVGHVYVAAFIAIDNRVYFGCVPVNSTPGDEPRT